MAESALIQRVDFSLAPHQAEHLDQIRQAAIVAGSSGRGRVLFITGPSGSGKTHLLRHAADSLPDEVPGSRVVSGGIADGRYTPESDGEKELKTWSTLATVLSFVGELPVPLLSPALKVLARTLEASEAARELILKIREQGERGELTDVFEPLLSAAAREDPGSALICMIDDADWLGAGWWLNLQFSFAGVIARELPLVLVLVVDGPAESGGDQGEKADGYGVAQSLIERGVADACFLDGLTAVGVSDWFGPMQRSLAFKLVEATGGLAGDCADLWTHLKREEMIEEADGGAWRLASGARFGLDYGAKRLGRNLAAALGDVDPARTEWVRRVLACAALEGRSFTAEAVAMACEGDRDEVIDLLDELADEEVGHDPIVRELGAVEITDLARRPARHLWRYGFVRTLDWRVARTQFGDGPDIEKSSELARHILELYGHESTGVAHVIARLLGEAGKEDEAREFEQVATLRISNAVLETLCRRFLSSETSGWTAYDFYNAAEVLLRGCSDLQRAQSIDKSIAYAKRAEELAREAGPRGAHAVASALCARGRLESLAGNTDRARELLEEALNLSRHGSQSVLALTMRELGVLSWRAGPDLVSARRYLSEALDTYRRIRSLTGQGTCLSQIAEINIAEGDFDSALARNAEALEIAHGSGDEVNFAADLHQRARIALSLGEFDAARKMVLEVLAFQRRHGRHADEAACLLILGSVELKRGNLDTARTTCLRALTISKRIDGRNGGAECLRVLGEVEAKAGVTVRARAYFEQAAVLFENMQDFPRQERCLSWLERLKS